MQQIQKIILITIIQIGLVLGLATYFNNIVVGGDVVYLSIEPLDPTDPFRGDYVEFQLDINSIPIYLFDSNTARTRDEDFAYQEGDIMYVDLVPQNRVHQPVSVSANLPVSPRGTIIQGQIIDIIRSSDDPGMVRESEVVRVKYGIEQYFIPEGTGRNVDFGSKEAVAEVRVKGYIPIITNIYLDNVLWP